MPRNLRFPAVLASLVLVTTACNWPWQNDAAVEDSAPETLPFDEGTDEQPGETTTTTATLTDDEEVGTIEVGQAQGPDNLTRQPVTPLDIPSSPTTRPNSGSDSSSSNPPATENTGTTSTPTTSSTTPTTTAPTTAAPTPLPTTAAPTTATPTTTAPTTVPTTAVPTTAVPTTAAPTTTTTAAPAGPVLVWSEEFNSLNTNKWKLEHSTYGDGGRTMQCYTPQQATVSGGSLVLTAEKRTETCPNSSPYGSTRDYTSGMVRSKGVTFSPGQRIVYRVKLTPNDDANQGGLWPSLWASGWAGGGWPAGGEWDGFEVMTAVDPARTVFGLHYANSLGNHAKSSKAIYSNQNFSANWHILEFDYGLDGVMTWRMDGQIMTEQSNLDTLQGWPAPFDQSMTELKINLALGGNPGPLDDRALPATYEVDYVRIYDLP